MWGGKLDNLICNLESMYMLIYVSRSPEHSVFPWDSISPEWYILQTILINFPNLFPARDTGPTPVKFLASYKFYGNWAGAET